MNVKLAWEIGWRLGMAKRAAPGDPVQPAALPGVKKKAPMQVPGGLYNKNIRGLVAQKPTTPSATSGPLGSGGSGVDPAIAAKQKAEADTLAKAGPSGGAGVAPDPEGVLSIGSADGDSAANSSGAAPDPNGVLKLDPSTSKYLDGGGGQQGQEGPANMQRAEIVRGFGHSSTPEQMAAGVTPDYLADMTEMGIQNSHNRRVMRGLQKTMGVNFRPIKGGMRSTDIKLENIKDPRQRQAWTLMKNQLAANEATQSVAGGQRAGWSTAGSGFSGGGVRAARGRGAPAQQLASTGQASSIGNAVMAAQPDVAAPARDATANFNMSEGTGASAAGKMNVVGGPKAWIARGNTEAYDGDPSRSLSIDYKPPTAQTPTPPPPAAASAPVLGPISGDSARGIQASVNKQMAAGSGMALPPPVAFDSTDAPASIVPRGDTLAQPDNIDKVAPIPTGNEPIDMGAAGFKKTPAKPPVPSSIRWKQPTSSRIG